ncbi:hypothetical protein FDA52_15470 [Clostridium botulinum]|nr:hypothetical protein [Clostridium botulinum]
MNFIKNILSIADSSVIVLLIFITKWNPISILEPYLPQYFSEKLIDESSRLTINTAIILLLFKGISAIFSRPIKISADLNNLDGTPFTNIPVANVNQRFKKLNLDIKVDFKNKLLKYIINILGGAYIFVENTRWTTIQAEKKSALFRSAIDDNTTNEYICIDIIKFFGREELKKKLRVNINILSKSIEPLPGSIYVKFGSKKRNKLIDCFLNLLISYEECKHDIQSSGGVI